jgi:alkylation response protein AidB-like acyl-CoA dehydrogenase
VTAAGSPQAVPDLRYGEAEEQLRAVVRDLLADRSPWPAVLARAGAGQGNDLALWHTLAGDLGCAGLLIPEGHGGAGASYREAAVVAEETGRATACVPYLGSAVMATTALLASGDELLTGLASGVVTAALAAGFATVPPVAGPAAGPWPVRVGAPDRGGAPGAASLSGTVPGVADALAADVLLVPGDGVPFGLYAVDARAPGVRREPVVSLDATRPLADMTLDRVPGRPVAAGPAAAAAVAAALTAGAAMLASEQLGVAERCLEETVGYVRQRRQFAGAQAPPRRRVGGGDPGPRRRQVRRRLPRGGGSGRAGRGGPGQGGLRGRGRAGRGGMRAAARRDRLHLGASRAPAAEAGRERVAGAGQPGPPPGGAGIAGRPAALRQRRCGGGNAV